MPPASDVGRNERRRARVDRAGVNVGPRDRAGPRVGRGAASASGLAPLDLARDEIRG
jgi:hypothetical protein